MEWFKKIPYKTYKRTYCSTPTWLPECIRKRYEVKNCHICKVHDNQSGVKRTEPQWIVDCRFFINILISSKENLFLRLPLAIISFIFVRIKYIISNG